MKSAYEFNLQEIFESNKLSYKPVKEQSIDELCSNAAWVANQVEYVVGYLLERCQYYNDKKQQRDSFSKLNGGAMYSLSDQYDTRLGRILVSFNINISDEKVSDARFVVNALDSETIPPLDFMHMLRSLHNKLAKGKPYDNKHADKPDYSKRLNKLILATNQ